MKQRRFLLQGILFSGMLCFISVQTLCQNLRVIDSLKRELSSRRLESQFDLLNAIGFEYRYSFPDSTIQYCTKAYELGLKTGIKKGLSRPLCFIGLAKTNQGGYREALEFHNRSIEVAQQQNDTLQLAHGYNNAGRIFFDEGDLVRAYTNYMKSKELFEAIHDKSGLAYVYRSLASLFKSKKDYARAWENSEKALALRNELGDLRAITSALMELGLVYEEMDTTPLALRQFERADSIATIMNDEITKAELKIGIAEILFMEKRIKEASSIAESVLTIVSENTNQKIFLRARLVVAKCYMVNKDEGAALLVLTQVYGNSEKSGNLAFQRDAAQLLSEVYNIQKKQSLAKEYDDIFQILNEKIQNADLNNEIERLQFQLQIEKTEKENVSLKARQGLDESLILKQRSENLLLIIVVLFAIVLAIFTWTVSRKRKIVNRKLEDQNLHILHQREEIAKQNEILSQSNRDLDALNHEKDTLMNIVAHDLKSPLNRISGLARILEMEGNLNSTQIEYVRLIKESTGGGLDLITDLLDVHAWQELRDNPKPSAFQFGNFFNEKIQTFQPVAETKGILIKTENQFDQKIISEPNYLSRILENLLSNAIKFSPRNATIEVKGTWKAGYLQITVKDAGPGFSEEDRSLLFQKFKKLSARPTAGESSNGLGLAIVKTLVDRLGGSIELTTHPGKGSEFLVRIPVEIFQEVPA